MTLLVSLVAGLLVARGAAAAEARRPNILLIYADDQSYKTLSCYPESPAWVKTPEIDRLAASGIRFTRAYMGSWCMPSRASILTGRLPFGVESMRMSGSYPGSSCDPALCPFWPAEARRQGYQTAQIGKWHTGVDSGWERDWDYQIVWNRPKHPENAGAYYKKQILAFNGQERKTDGYSTDNYTDWAVDYIRGQNRVADKPWFLWLCYGAIHGPTTPADRHKGKLAGNTAKIPADIFGPRPNKPSYLDRTQAWIPNGSGGAAMKKKPKQANNFDKDEPGLDYSAWIQQVNECTMALDEGVGRVMAALRDSGQLENTLVVYTADQGYGLGEHGLSQKQVPYDGGVASPLIISQPGTIPAGKVCAQPVNSPDLVATFLRVGQINVPWKTHGRDIAPLLRDPERATLEQPMLMSHTGDTYGSNTRDASTTVRSTGQGNVPWWVMVRDGRFKYIRTLVAGEPEELYDLDADPEELTNLAGRAEQASQLETMRAKLIAELRRTDCPFVDAMPPVRELKR
ncbi:MAG: sulfatase-like hydrolase/transferase [Planctomycetes bacterium]|nr:sulfatase-like hydrolase/transferase [Planctomycetota bacterium]